MSGFDWDGLPRGKDGRLWGPDLFASLYDFLATTDGWRGQPAPQELEDAEAVVLWRRQAHRGKGWIDDALVSAIREAADEAPDVGGGALALLHALMAVDRAYAGVGLGVDLGSRARVDEYVWDLIDQWEKRGSLEREAAGKVLRKATRWRKGRALAHYCDNLTRVMPHDAVRVRPTVASRDFTVFNGLDSADGLRVAFVPLLHEPADVRFVPHDDGPSRRFRVELDPKRQEVLCGQMSDLVARLEQGQVSLALFPETVAGPAALKSLRDAMIDNFEYCVAQGRHPRLQAAVLGVQPEPGRNETVLVGADGATLLTQPKMQPWRLDAAQQRRYGLGASLGALELEEDLAGEGTLHVLDVAGFGRAITLICEDIVRPDPARRLAVDVGPRLVFCPVMDGSLGKRRWAYKAAGAVADEPGALVLVVNSCVLAARQRAASGSSARRPSVGVAIVCHPEEWGQSGVVTARGRPRFVTRDVSWRT